MIPDATATANTHAPDPSAQLAPDASPALSVDSAAGQAQDLARAVTPAPGGSHPIMSFTFQTADPEWDAFLSRTPGGHYAQASFWAESKAEVGWQVARVIARQTGGQIVGGAQLLLKKLPVGGSVAVAYKAPVVAPTAPEATALILTEVHRVARQLRVQYLTIQPPEGGESMSEQLCALGYRPCQGWGYPPVTTTIDLTQDIDQIAQRMHKDVRRNLRKAQRAGIHLRVGTEADLDTFYDLLVSTSKRNSFGVQSMAYYRRLWRSAAAQGAVQLFFAEGDGEVLATGLRLCLGDTMYGLAAGRSGARDKDKPNELLYWETINWAKAHGYRRFDFGGIDSTGDLASKIASGKVTLDDLQRLHTFKLGFGGDVVCSPIAYEYVPNPALRLIYQGIWRNERLQGLMHKAGPLLRGMGGAA